MSKTPLLPTPKSHVEPRPRPPDPLWRVIVVLLTVVGGLYSASLAVGLLANSEFDRLTTNITLDSDYDTGEGCGSGTEHVISRA